MGGKGKGGIVPDCCRWSCKRASSDLKVAIVRKKERKSLGDRDALGCSGLTGIEKGEGKMIFLVGWGWWAENRACASKAGLEKRVLFRKKKLKEIVKGVHTTPFYIACTFLLSYYCLSANEGLFNQLFSLSSWYLVFQIRSLSLSVYVHINLMSSDQFFTKLIIIYSLKCCQLYDCVLILVRYRACIGLWHFWSSILQLSK